MVQALDAPILELESLALGIWGDIKTCKTTFALTFPKPLIHFDLDQGIKRALPRFREFSYQQVAENMPLSSVTKLTDIISKPYRLPIKWPGQPVASMLSLWDVFMDDLRVACETPEIKTIVVDTGSVLWRIATQAHLERVQKEKPERVNLIQIEYAKPNTEMRGAIGAVKAYGKNLVMVHHVGGIYKDVLTAKGVEQQRVGDTWEGFGGMGGMVDIVVRAYIDHVQGNYIAGKGLTYTQVPTIAIETSGVTLAAEGMTLPNPKYETLMGLLNALRTQGA